MHRLRFTDWDSHTVIHTVATACLQLPVCEDFQWDLQQEPPTGSRNNIPGISRDPETQWHHWKMILLKLSFLKTLINIDKNVDALNLSNLSLSLLCLENNDRNLNSTHLTHCVIVLHNNATRRNVSLDIFTIRFVVSSFTVLNCYRIANEFAFPYIHLPSSAFYHVHLPLSKLIL